MLSYYPPLLLDRHPSYNPHTTAMQDAHAMTQGHSRRHGIATSADRFPDPHHPIGSEPNAQWIMTISSSPTRSAKCRVHDRIYQSKADARQSIRPIRSGLHV